MPADLKLYESTDTSEVTSISFAGAVPGSATAAQEFHLWNHKGASGDTAQQIRLSVLARKQSVGGPYLGAGLDVLDQNAFQVRIIGGQGISPASTGWQDMGASASPELPDLPANSTVEFELRVDPQAGVDISELEAALVVSSSLSRSIGDGHSLMGADGVVMRLGHLQEFGIIRAGTVVEDSGGASFDVDVAAWAWVCDGEIWAVWTDTVTVGATDGSGNTPASGEQFIALLTGAADGSITVTKGDLAAAGSETSPEKPAGEPLLATIVVDDTSIVDADIDAVTEHDYFGMADDFSAIGPGVAVADGRIIRRTSSEAPTGLGASATFTIWLTRTGNLSVASGAHGAAPSDGAVSLYEVDTDGASAITAARDLRRLIGPFVEHQIQFRIDGTGGSSALQAADASPPAGIPGFGRRRQWIHPFDTGIVLYVDDDGGTSGETSVDLESNPGGAGWASLFDGAALAQLPQVAQGDTTLWSFGHFIIWHELLAGDQLRASINSVPASAPGTVAVLSVTVLSI